MFLHPSVAAFAATISFCLLSVAFSRERGSDAALYTPPLANADNDWWKDVTVVAITPDGTWGVATEPSMNIAITSAIRDCIKKKQAKIGCGSQIISIRGG